MATEIENIENELFNDKCQATNTDYSFFTKTIDVNTYSEDLKQVVYYFTATYGYDGERRRDVLNLVLDSCIMECEIREYGFICTINILTDDYNWKPLLNVVLDFTRDTKEEMVEKLRKELKNACLILYAKNVDNIKRWLKPKINRLKTDDEAERILELFKDKTFFENVDWTSPNRYNGIPVSFEDSWNFKICGVSEEHLKEFNQWLGQRIKYCLNLNRGLTNEELKEKYNLERKVQLRKKSTT